jgi:hypothetical protein
MNKVHLMNWTPAFAEVTSTAHHGIIITTPLTPTLSRPAGGEGI